MQTASHPTSSSGQRLTLKMAGSLAVTAIPLLALWLDIGVGAEAALPIAAGAGFILGAIWRSWLPALAVMVLGAVYTGGILALEGGSDVVIVGIVVAAVLGFLPAAVGAVIGAFVGAIMAQWLNR